MKSFRVTLLVSALAALLLIASGVLQRVELQFINKLFESRRWITWAPESLARLNPRRLWRYHQSHEIPRKFWAWDYTLSWLIENNHPAVKHKFVIFNHSLEDEPPRDAVAYHPWMKPLMQYPPSRATVAQSVEFLARNGAKEIILDNDFPEYSDDDAVLAQSIHDAASGKFSDGRPVPVLMASTVVRRAFAGALQTDGSTLPCGVLEHLHKLEPETDVVQKYTGMTTIAMDEDQVVRRLACYIPNAQGQKRTSLVIKALSSIGEPVPDKLPALMDIDFASPPQCDLYPVRPFSYLLDPDKQQKMGDPNSADVTIRDAIVFLGDDVVDVYPTPYTNEGVNLMSGTEILAQSMDTITRHSWPHRLTALASLAYIMFACLVASMIFGCRSIIVGKFAKSQVARRGADIMIVLSVLLGIYAVSVLAFASSSLLIPCATPIVAIALGCVAALIFEKEDEYIKALNARLQSAKTALELEQARHEAQIAMERAEAKAHELNLDQQRRREFVRRINHDLKAPVTVLNWTLAKLKREGLSNPKANERLEHIGRTSDRLFDLMAELVRTYETSSCEPEQKQAPEQLCDLANVLFDCVRMQQAFAEVNGGQLSLDLPEYSLVTQGAPLEFSRVFDNLIRNAFLHNPPGTRVEIIARTRANLHQIVVSDNGKGINQSVINKIFDAEFSRSSAEAAEGLGLSIVKTTVEKFGGSISVDSSEEAGTSFTLSFPAISSTSFDAVDVPVVSSAQAVSF